VFPVSYELNLYMSFSRNSVFKGLRSISDSLSLRFLECIAMLKRGKSITAVLE
jgi:hypothetical protein